MNKWQTLLAELSELGFSQYEIAETVGCSQSYINALAKGQRGKALSFDIGFGILQMAEKANKQQLKPRRRMRRMEKSDA